MLHKVNQVMKTNSSRSLQRTTSFQTSLSRSNTTPLATLLPISRRVAKVVTSKPMNKEMASTTISTRTHSRPTLTIGRVEVSEAIMGNRAMKIGARAKRTMMSITTSIKMRGTNIRVAMTAEVINTRQARNKGEKRDTRGRTATCTATKMGKKEQVLTYALATSLQGLSWRTCLWAFSSAGVRTKTSTQSPMVQTLLLLTSKMLTLIPSCPSIRRIRP